MSSDAGSTQRFLELARWGIVAVAVIALLAVAGMWMRTASPSVTIWKGTAEFQLGTMRKRPLNSPYGELEAIETAVAAAQRINRGAFAGKLLDEAQLNPASRDLTARLLPATLTGTNPTEESIRIELNAGSAEDARALLLLAGEELAAIYEEIRATREALVEDYVRFDQGRLAYFDGMLREVASRPSPGSGDQVTIVVSPGAEQADPIVSQAAVYLFATKERIDNLEMAKLLLTPPMLLEQTINVSASAGATSNLRTGMAAGLLVLFAIGALTLALGFGWPSRRRAHD